MSKPKSSVDSLAEHLSERTNVQFHIAREWTVSTWRQYGGQRTAETLRYWIIAGRDDGIEAQPSMRFGPYTNGQAKRALAMVSDLLHILGLELRT